MLNPDRRVLLDELVAAGTPLSVMHREYGFNYSTVRKYYPTYRSRESNEVTDWVAANRIPVVRELLDERAPVKLIAEAAGIGERKRKRLFPEASWSRVESGTFGGQVASVSRNGFVC